MTALATWDPTWEMTGRWHPRLHFRGRIVVEDLYYYAKLYYEKWRVTPIAIMYKEDMIPLVKWSDYYNNPDPVFPPGKWEEATGIAILPRAGHVVIDIDEFNNDEERYNVARWLSKDGYAVVLTRRGLHIHFNIKNKEIGEIRLYRGGKRVGEGGGSKYKHLWTVPPTRRGSFTYQFYGSDGIPDLLTLPDLDAFFTDLTMWIADLEWHEVKQKQLSGSLTTLETIDPVCGIEELNEDELLALLTGIYHALNCPGLRDLVLEWVTTGRVNMRKFNWSGRTSRFYFLHTIAATLALLGASEQQVASLLNKYEDVDGKPADAHNSALWTVYRWKAPLHKKLYVLKRGECPFCTLRGYRNCGKNPVMRVYWWLQSRRGRETVTELVQYMLSKRQKIS